MEREALPNRVMTTRSRSSFRAALWQVSTLLLAALVWAVPASRGAADLDEILQRKVLRVGLPSSESPPFLTTDSAGVLGGYEGELVRALAARLPVGLEIDRSAPDADALVAAVRSGKVDVGLGQIADTLDRAREVRFSRPYVQVREARVFDRVALARAGGEGTYLARPSLRVAVTAGSAFADPFRIAYPAAEVVAFPGMTEALAEVAAGRVALFVADAVSVARWWETHPASAIRLETVVHPERDISYAAAVHWRAERLQAWLNLFLDKCERDGTFAGLRTRHLEPETSAEGAR